MTALAVNPSPTSSSTPVIAVTEAVKRFGDLATALADYRGAVVTTTPREKGAYCRDGGITCQFSGLKDLRGTHRGLRLDGAALKIFQPADAARRPPPPEPWHRDAGFAYATVNYRGSVTFGRTFR